MQVTLSPHASHTSCHMHMHLFFCRTHRHTAAAWLEMCLDTATRMQSRGIIREATKPLFLDSSRPLFNPGGQQPTGQGDIFVNSKGAAEGTPSCPGEASGSPSSALLQRRISCSDPGPCDNGLVPSPQYPDCRAGERRGGPCHNPSRRPNIHPRRF